MPAKEAKDSFGLLLDTAQREPVAITRKGRQVAVVLSSTDYERLEALEDAYWGRVAEEAAKEGFVGVEEGEKLVAELLHAKD
jgi:prevent-host-death family protein